MSSGIDESLAAYEDVSGQLGDCFLFTLLSDVFQAGQVILLQELETRNSERRNLESRKRETRRVLACITLCRYTSESRNKLAK
jgi:endonuclease/exonuclease/phosphatase family metal-dependent hydrolase